MNMFWGKKRDPELRAQNGIFLQNGEQISGGKAWDRRTMGALYRGPGERGWEVWVWKVNKNGWERVKEKKESGMAFNFPV